MAATLPNQPARSPWPASGHPREHGSRGRPSAALPAAHLAHERLLREHTYLGEGLRVDVARALDLLASGQLVNCAFETGHPDAHPAHRYQQANLPAPSPFGAPDSSPADADPSAVEREFQAAQVLSADVATARLFLRVPMLPRGVTALQRAYVEFTEASGTYHLTGGVTRVGEGGEYVGLAVWQARLVQRRRFVRVPVALIPERLEVQAEDWTWHTVAGRIFDLSLGGLGLAVAEPLAAGASVRLAIELPELVGPLACAGRVVAPPGPAEARLAAPLASSSAAHVWYRRGIAFEPLPSDDLKRLQHALYQRQVALRRCYTAAPWPDSAAPLPAPPRQPRALWHFWSR